MTVQEFEAENIGELNCYYDLVEAYAKMKCLEQAETLFTKDQMILFAGFCMGRRMLDPTEDVSIILQDFKEDFKFKSL